jgi:hypothetical protein
MTSLIHRSPACAKVKWRRSFVVWHSEVRSITPARDRTRCTVDSGSGVARTRSLFFFTSSITMATEWSRC